MDLALISVMADTAAAFGVVASLLFVGYSVRQNSRGQRLTAVHAQTAAFQEMASKLIDTPDMAEIVWRGSQDLDKLEGVERMRFDVGVNNVFRAGQTAYWEWQHGVFDDKLFANIARATESFVSLPGVSAIWGTRCDQYTSDYQAFLDNCVAKGNQGTAYPWWRPEDTR
jgi:hypothetical protein